MVFISLSSPSYPILFLPCNPILFIPSIIYQAVLDTMAIHPRLRPRASQGSLSPQQALAISAWTEQAAASLEDLTLSESTPVDTPVDGPAASSTPTRSGLEGATVSLSIPLDDQPPVTPSPRVKVVDPASGETRPAQKVSFRRREPLRRDSLKRREALLKGKDGSRRRQRWENGMRVSGVPIMNPATDPD